MDEQRWDDLVADLDGQAEAYDAVEDHAEAGELARASVAAVTLTDRLRATTGETVVLAVRGVGPVRGTVRAAGPTWVQLDDGSRESVVAMAAVLSASGLGPDASAPPASAVENRWGIAHVLRRHARDRSSVRLVLDTGDVLSGTFDAVAADHVELAEHPAGEPRRRDAVLARRLVPFAAIAVVSRDRAI